MQQPGTNGHTPPPSGDLLAARRPRWSDFSWWQEELRKAIAEPEPVLCNLRITLAHYELSVALRELIGAGSGPNFHTWAVWGSKKAGGTIRREDVPHARLLAAAAGAGLAGGLALIAVRRQPGWRRASRASQLLAAALGGGLGLLAVVDALLDRASANVLAGNIAVLDDIGRATAGFLATFRDHPRPDRARLETFLATLRPGGTAAGGQELLREAFTHYYLARETPDPDARHEHMLLANLKAILHEHYRLQPYIAGAMPLLLRSHITSRLLSFNIGPERLSVSQDVLGWKGEDCPDFLRTLENADLVRFLVGPVGWDRTPDTVAGSRARNWANIRDRMNYICDLFRYRYFDPGLFSPPYTDEQWVEVLAGRAPAGPL